MEMEQKHTIKAIIGLGNPGNQYRLTHHNAGFLVIDALAGAYHGSWQQSDLMQVCTITINSHPVLLIKPLTFMNTSGQVVPFLQKKGIKSQETLVIHDELEKKPLVLGFKQGGSHRGHNGVRSLITAWGDDFLRLRVGIGRPDQREQVDKYVLQNFCQSNDDLEAMYSQAIAMIEELFK